MAEEAAARVSLCRGALASERQLAVHRCYIASRQIRAAVKVLGVVAGVAGLAEHRRPHLEQRRDVRTVRRVAIGTVVHNRRMLPEEWSPLFRVAGVAGFVYRLLNQQLRAV